MVGPGVPRVFISYSHDSEDHRTRVLRLSERLRKDGVETILDRYVDNGSPPEGWPRWMLNGLDRASHVLCICTETYYRRFRGHEAPGRGKGVDWEGALMTYSLYDARSVSCKFIPVLFTSSDVSHVPEPLQPQSFYVLDSDAGYQLLYDSLLSQIGVPPGPLGPLQKKVRTSEEPLVFSTSPASANILAPAFASNNSTIEIGSPQHGTDKTAIAVGGPSEKNRVHTFVKMVRFFWGFRIWFGGLGALWISVWALVNHARYISPVPGLLQHLGTSRPSSESPPDPLALPPQAPLSDMKLLPADNSPDGESQDRAREVRKVAPGDRVCVAKTKLTCYEYEDLSGARYIIDAFARGKISMVSEKYGRGKVIWDDSKFPPSWMTLDDDLMIEASASRR